MQRIKNTWKSLFFSPLGCFTWGEAFQRNYHRFMDLRSVGIKVMGGQGFVTLPSGEDNFAQFCLGV
jgi:hypothetical protein